MDLRSALSVSVAVGAILSVGAPAWAQSTAPAADTKLEEVIVTGSRIATAGYDAPTPTTVLSSAALAQRGSTNIGDFLNELPSFRTSYNRQTAPQAGQAGAVYADLRGLGSIRTLVLVDGRRHVPSTATGQVDLNLIPTALIDRAEVVTGGASAIYGSDAVSGVVNILLNKKLQGFKGDVSLGISNEKDDMERRASLAGGTSFAGGRGHVVVGGDFVKSNGVNSYYRRDWGRRGDELISNPTNRPAGQASRFYAPGVTYTGSPLGGIIIGPNADLNPANGADVLRGIGFNQNSQSVRFDYGNDNGGGSAYNFTAPEGARTRLGHQLILPQDRKVVMGHVDYDFTDYLSGFLEASYAKSGGEFNGPQIRDTSTTTIVLRQDYAYLPADVRQIMVANNIQTFSLGRPNEDWEHAFNRNFNTTQRFVGGLSGKLPFDWNWDTYYEYGNNVYENNAGPNRVEQRFRFAYDAVVNPANGQIVCRATLPGPAFNAAAAGCAPVNLLGYGAPSAAARAYVNVPTHTEIEATQQVAELNLNGNLFSTWAGPIGVAVGASYRKDETTQKSDPLQEAGVLNYGNAKPFAGSFDTKEAYGEVLVPLAKDMLGARSLEFNGAVRYTDYSSSGNVTTWKAGLTWEPVIGLKFRGTRSRDIRAPNPQELFSFTTGLTTLTNPFSGASRTLPTVNLPSASLEPEEADTKTFGVVFSPTFVPGLQASVDYFDITINGAISSYAPQFLLDQCAAEVARNAPGLFCSYVDRSGSGTTTEINLISVQLLNIASLKSSGVDFDVSYRRPVGDANITARLNGTYTEHLISDDGLGNKRTYNAAGILQSKGSLVDRAGQVGGFFSNNAGAGSSVPHWILNGSVTFAQSRYSGTLQGRWVGGGKVDKTLVDPSESDYDPRSPISVLNNDVKGRFYINLQGSVNLITRETKKVQLYGVVENLTNVDPPFPTTAVSGLYDRQGRYYRMGLRFNY